jgi:hypothetical protein
MVRRRNDVVQAHRELIRRARFEVALFVDRLHNEILPAVSEEFNDAVQEGGLDVPEFDRERMETLVKRAVLRALNVNEKGKKGGGNVLKP